MKNRLPRKEMSMTIEPDLFARGWQHHQAGEYRQAEEVYRQILRTDTRNGRVWFVLANLCQAQDRLAEAVACYRQAVEIEPREVMGHLHLGNALLQLSRPAEAEAAYRRCLQIKPDHLEALVNLGFVLGEQDRLDEARACYEQALKIDPSVAETHHNLGNVLREQGKVDEALAHYDEALRLRPDYAKAHVNKGVALVARCEIDAAVRCFRRGVELQPDFAEAHNSLGTALSAEGNLAGALQAYERALSLKPDYPDAQWNRALVWLLQGDYERGWRDYEWRWKCRRPFPLPAFRQPRWDGSPLEGRTILLYAEQGLGDTLHFIRYAALVKARGGRVVVQCQRSLLPLLSRTPGIDRLAAWGDEPPPFDVYAPLMSLPGLLGTTLQTIPREVPYLFADPERIDHWRRDLVPIPGFRVGIVWQGSIRHPWDRHRSIPLALFEPLAAVPGVRLVSLQRGPGAEQVEALAGRFPVACLGDQVDQAAGAFMDTAGILHNLDLLIAVDTAVAHLAGGLGLPVWLAVHHTPDWRWGLGREDNPWYPTVHLFRQNAPGDWSTVMERMARELVPLADRRARSRPLLVEIAPGELFDKLTILEIKSERMADAEKQKHVRAELAVLRAARDTLELSPEVADLLARLKAVNEALWEIEDAIRLCERGQDFGPRFVELARSVYLTNDRRAALKRAINDFFHSPLAEEKLHPDYGS
jgi:tetratricopeptide (TPR) repeat protein